MTKQLISQPPIKRNTTKGKRAVRFNDRSQNLLGGSKVGVDNGAQKVERAREDVGRPPATARVDDQLGRQRANCQAGQSRLKQKNLPIFIVRLTRLFQHQILSLIYLQ